MTADLRAAGALDPSAPAAVADNFTIIRRLFRDYVRKQWPMLSVAVAGMAMTAAMTAALAWLTDPAIKFLFLAKDKSALIWIPLAILGVVVLRAVTQFLQQSLMDTVGERAVAETQRDMMRSLVYQDLRTLNAVHSGQFVSNFIYDATLMRDAIVRGIAGLGLELISLVGLTAVMIYQDWRLAAIAVVVMPGVAWVSQVIGASLRRAASRGMEKTAELSVALSETLDGKRIIKAYGLEDHITARTDERLNQRLRFLLRVVRTRAAAVPSTDLFGGVVIAATMFYAGYQAMHGELGINHFASFLTALLLALQPVRNLTQLWATASSGISAADRIFGVIDQTPRIVDRPGAQTLAIAPAPRGGAIAFEDVHFSYDARSASVDGVSFHVAPGEKVALVGPSGAGKSTIFNLLLRFYDTGSGRILIDGHDIRDVTLKSLRRNIALVTQEAILFDETVAENISLGNLEAPRTAQEAAAQNAAADEFVRALPQGYDTRVGEAGLKLSGGQRQRIAIARAMLRDAPILLLDEATSALDTESERQVQDALTRLMKNRTTIVIAHRLSTVLDADRIYVLDKGKVVESGTHAALLAQGGLYARLYQHDFDEEQG
ncbi:MAG: ABC transporter ATP-binding protein [Rhizomicrobium sp.]